MVVEEAETPDSVRSLAARESTISLKHLISGAKRGLTSTDSRDSQGVEGIDLGPCGVIDEDPSSATAAVNQDARSSDVSSGFAKQAPADANVGPSAAPAAAANIGAAAAAAEMQLAAREKVLAGHDTDHASVTAIERMDDPPAQDSNGPFNAMQGAVWGGKVGHGSEYALSRCSSAAESGLSLGSRLSPPRVWRPGGSREGSTGGAAQMGQKAKDYADAVEKKKRRASGSRRNSCASAAASTRGSEAGVSPPGLPRLSIGASMSRDLSRNQSISSGRASLAGSMPVSPSRDNYDKPWRTGMASVVGSDSRSGSASRSARGEKLWEEGELKLAGCGKADVPLTGAVANLANIGDSLASNSHIQQLQVMKMQLVSQLFCTPPLDMQSFGGSATSTGIMDRKSAVNARTKDGVKSAKAGVETSGIGLGGIGSRSVSGGVKRGAGSHMGSRAGSAASSSGGACSESQMKLLQMLAEQAKQDEENNKGSDVFNR
jgi:hypothetical protein